MNARLKINMSDVTRLTRDGRLAEAMSILRGAFPGFVSPNLAGDKQPGSKAPTIHMVPPSLLNGKLWTSPQTRDADRLSDLGWPKALGGIGERWPQLGLG